MCGKNNLFGATTRAFSLIHELECCSNITLNRSVLKKTFNFESYAEMREHFGDLVYNEKVTAVVITGAGKKLLLWGYVCVIIGPLTKIMKKLIAFTRMTGDLVKAIRNFRLPSLSAVSGICTVAGTILAMASDVKVCFPHLRSNSFFVKYVLL